MARIVVSTVEKAYLKVILVSGLVVGVLDGLNAIIIYKLVLDFNPIPIYQFVASGMLGPKAYEGGMATALLGLGVHFLVAFSSSASYILAAQKISVLRKKYILMGLLYGAGVFFFMNYVVIPLSLIPSAPFNLVLFINGMFGHALLVGLPSAIGTQFISPH
jgi:hypothetical protein